MTNINDRATITILSIVLPPIIISLLTYDIVLFFFLLALTYFIEYILFVYIDDGIDSILKWFLILLMLTVFIALVSTFPLLGFILLFLFVIKML